MVAKVIKIVILPLLYMQTSRDPRTMILAIFSSVFLSATAQLRSLLEAIHDCRDKANALDWEAWNRNYF